MAERASITPTDSATVPASVTQATSANILLARMKSHPALAGIAVAEPSIPHQALAPPSIEIANTYVELQRIIEYRSLVGPQGHVAFGAYLDELGDQEMGVSRLSAVPARRGIRVTGYAGAMLPEGTRLLAPAQGVGFRMLLTATVGADGTGGGIAECEQPGAIGNVPAGAINKIDGPPIQGITAVTNPSGVPLVAGADVETDDAYRTRLLRYRRDPPNGCNAAQFRMWAEEVPGVGRAEVIRPLEPVGPDGQQPPPPGTVQVYVTGSDLIEVQPNGLMATQGVVDAVQQYIAPLLPAVTLQPGDWPANVYPDNGATYQAGVLLPTDLMVIAGIWTLRPALSIAYSGDPPVPPPPDTPVITYSVFNVTDGVILDGRPNGYEPEAATRTFTAGELGETPPSVAASAPAIEFYWDGAMVPQQKTIEIRVERTALQATPGYGTVTMHGVWLLSAFSDPTHEALAPVDDRVEVYASKPVPITVAASIEPKPGWTVAAATAWAEDAIKEYLRSIVYAGSAAPVAGLPNRRANDVLYGMIGAVLYGGCVQGDTPLMYYDPASLRLNGGTLDIEVWTGDVAVLEAVEFTLIEVAPLPGMSPPSPPPP